jgi:hypothetical protein
VAGREAGHDVGLAMHHPRDYLPALDRIEAALEASCGALVTLESIKPGPADDLRGIDGTHGHLRLAIGSLREAIEELRLAQSKGSSALASGFVLEGNGRAPRGVQPDPGQSKPRRTA